MEELQTKPYCYFVGIDMSKLKFDVGILDIHGKKIGHRQFSNNETGFILFSSWILEKVQTLHCLYCMEYTGIYSRKLWHFIEDQNWHLWMQSGFEIKCKAGMRKTKTDKADSFMIAHYALSNHYTATIENKYDENIEILHDLLSARNRLISDIKRLQVPLDELKTYGGNRSFEILDKVHEAAIVGLKESLKSLNEAIDNLVKSNSDWHENVELTCSIKGVGMVVCLWILVYTKNFNKKYNARQFASLAGVAPFVYESGTSVRKGSHTHHCSHKFLKGILHTAAMSAIRSNKPIKAYFRKKKEEGFFTNQQRKKQIDSTNICRS